MSDAYSMARQVTRWLPVLLREVTATVGLQAGGFGIVEPTKRGH
ncbi:hypothetical protein [Halorientalis marina]|nr:hypothetical protein [Halorientalis marina]